MAKSKGYKHEYKTRAYNVDYKPGESDLQYYKRLAKVADQRLVRLEELAGLREGKPGVPGYEAVTQYAYAKAMRDLELYGGGTVSPPSRPRARKTSVVALERLTPPGLSPQSFAGFCQKMPAQPMWSR